MSDQFWISLPQILISLATLLTALGTLVYSVKSKNKLDVVHEQIDGMKSELVASTAKASKAEGKAEGVKEEQDRVDTKSEPQAVHVVNTSSEPLPVVTIKVNKP